MTLLHHSYGKGRVRVMRVARDDRRHEVREATVAVLLEGGFGASWTAADNAAVIATDSIKNIVNVTAHAHVGAGNEQFAQAIAAALLEHYPQIERARVDVVETVWQRMTIDGRPHPHGFVAGGNGRPVVRIDAGREATQITSGIEGFTLMKSTGSGWTGYVMDEFTTLKETTDRICATSMDATWHWQRQPTDLAAANAAVLEAMLRVFATTYSQGVQDSMYRMGRAALDAQPEIAEIRLAMPNKHYLPIDLSPFGLDNGNKVFLPTDEPHGQIECTVGRG